VLQQERVNVSILKDPVPWRQRHVVFFGDLLSGVIEHARSPIENVTIRIETCSLLCCLEKVTHQRVFAQHIHLFPTASEGVK
jgi:hypothetical protein